MANTYTQIQIHAVFAVRFRDHLIKKSWQEDLHKYISGILKNQEHQVLAINSMPDHLHVLFRMRPIQSVSDLLQDIKGGSSRWINEQRLSPHLFRWQEGFGAFSIGLKDIPVVKNYIQRQEEHHRKISFREEYRAFLKDQEISFDEKYIFTDPLTAIM